MKEEFNPTKKDLFNLEQTIIELKGKKSILIKSKISNEAQLRKFKEKYQNVDFESKEFFEIKQKRSNLKKAATSFELKIKKINEELRVKNRLKNEVKHFLSTKKSLEGGEDLERVIKKLEILKKKYKDFTKDRTRISSLRIMASEFVSEIEKILK